MRLNYTIIIIEYSCLNGLTAKTKLKTKKRNDIKLASSKADAHLCERSKMIMQQAF